MAAVAVTFARYFLELTNLRVADKVIAALALAALTAINCFGVRAGSSVQSFLMVLKIVAILALIVCGLWLVGLIGPAPANEATAARGGGGGRLFPSFGVFWALGACLGPGVFRQRGWPNSAFLGGGTRRAQKKCPPP